VALGMFGFGYALVPFYYEICEAWGIYSLGETRAANVNTQIDSSRTVTIEFDANARNLPWRFRPLVSHVEVHPGELATVEYEVVNTRGRAGHRTGRAELRPSPTPASTSTRSNASASGSRRSRRRDAAHAGDLRGRSEAARGVSSIALSYTFFEVAGAEESRDGR
jgi:cytochrome c oxidase assembly protein subunit 11